MAVMSFLAGLPTEFDGAWTQILSNPEIASLHDTFSWVLRVEGSRSSSNVTSALVSLNNVNGIGWGNKRGNNGGNGGRNGHDFQNSGSASRGQYKSNQRVCYYCKKPGHTIRTCWLLHGKPQQNSQFANFANQESNYVPSSSDKSILVSADEFARFTEYQASQKSVNPLLVFYLHLLLII